MNFKIGVTSFIENKNNNPYMCLDYDYIKAVIRMGYIPIIIPITSDEKVLDKYLNLVDGLIISGGEDINPEYYKEQPIQELGRLSPDRDLTESILIKKAIENKIPLLGICRGCQFINAIMGGTLYQDIYKQLKDVNGHSPSNISNDLLYHDVEILEDTLLHNILKKDIVRVNSFHHQAIKIVGRGLKISAKSKDGIIEAVESEDGNILCVQWHPESLSEKYEDFLNIFKVFFNNEKGSL
ncbi:gamma-glutamyl-gamma-aminobutyrate hydrolase family protein [Sedimentibacter sp. zth1]|uniref:gamma-glutamyl-gamma-aminobutyrate hydrolase family protein n=1 Tax=Sedimentibacter sp. zth1 TaxID=2816908 RepID=UPI001A916CB7|nr:gamma-glutamyl-gamma-aminobutyrate hydrolase family protein [Sedimentibacter sp. zth1]QSX04864.1 gamma-glutamyl-gamma-aminobutyrate hydrolase family protein [Sedimentibacter sp. zth1]